MRGLAAILMLFAINSLWSKSLWNCHLTFSGKNYFHAQSPWKKIAAKKVVELCKNTHNTPKNCHTKNIHCHLTIDGAVEGRYWQCMAMDAHGVGFKNQPESSYDTAALESMAACKHKSHVPETCSLNTITCHEL